MRSYHYNVVGTVITFLVTLAAWGMSFFAVSNLVVGWEYIGIAVLFGVFAVGMTRVSLTRATICIDDAGIAAEFWGLRTCFIDWSSASKIVKIRAPVAYATYIDGYQVYIAKRALGGQFFVNAFGNIAFDERIGNLQKLLDQINARAQEHSIPLFVWDIEAATKMRLSRTRSAKSGTRNEQPIERF